MNVINLIELETLTNGGCTYSLSAGEIISNSPLYALSLHKKVEEIIDIDQFDMNKIKMFIIKNSELLWQPNIAIGTWINENKVYLDVTTLFDKGKTTLEELKTVREDQLAAWDMETNEVINF